MQKVNRGKSEIELLKEKEKAKISKSKPASADEKLLIIVGILSIVIFLLFVVGGILYSPDGAGENIVAMLIIAPFAFFILRKVLL